MYEYANRVITCTNLKTNASISFTERGFTPFLLVKAEGIYSFNDNVNKQDNTMIDGATYQGTTVKANNIVLTLKDIDNYEDNRDLINSVFAPGALCSLVVSDGTHERMTEFYTESVNSTGTVNSRLTTLSLICPDPHFYDPYENIIRIANVMDCFEFPHAFKENGEPFSYINTNRTGEIINVNAEENTGITIVIMATGAVENPEVVKVETQEKIQIGYTGKPFSMVRGDIVTITTQSGNKNILYTHEGETVDINHFLSENSDYFQITRGKNTIGYNADSGDEHMEILISYKTRYLRA